MSSKLKEILNNFQIKQISSLSSASPCIYFLSGYNEAEEELYNLSSQELKCVSWVSGVKGMDYIVGKNYLWATLKDYYRELELNELVPKCYLLESKSDITDFLSNCKDLEEIFILKKNIQQQQGLVLKRRKELDSELLEHFHLDEFVIIQKYLKDPFLIDLRKINMRVYLLITIENNVLKAYIYNDGFIYYTESKYRYTTNVRDSVTTGLQSDRTVYTRNPLTHSDLRDYLTKEGLSPSKLFSNIRNCITKVLLGTKRRLSGHQGKLNFQLFGCDIQPDLNLNVKLIEINKAPSLEPKDSRDSKLKSRLQNDIFEVLNPELNMRSSLGGGGFEMLNI